MKYFVRLATEQDKPAVAKFYDNSLPLIDEKQTSWIKNIYPSIDTALKAIDLSQLFVCYDSNDIVSGTVILNNQSDKEYENITWSTPELDPNQILIIHTLVIDPKKLNQGIASAMINFIKDFGKSNSMVTVSYTHLDVYKRQVHRCYHLEQRLRHFLKFQDLNRQRNLDF